MSVLDNFPPELPFTYRHEVSKLFQSQSTQLPSINRSKSVQFIPFVQERDSMGRLLSKTYKTNHYQPDQQSVASSYFFRGDINQGRNTENANKINRAVQTFFKKIDLQEKQMKRPTFSPKKIAIVYDKAIPITHPIASQADAINNANIEKQINQFTKFKQDHTYTSNLIQKSQIPSPIVPKLHKTISSPSKHLLEKKTCSRHVEQSKGNRSNPDRDSVYDRQKNRKKNIIGGSLSLRIKQNMEHPELKRYRQMNKLAIKVIPDYQQGHQKFFEKMKQSKRIAHNIKKELQLE